MRARGYARRTESTYVYWIAFFIRFSNMQHPREMAEPHVVRFLEYLAIRREVTPSTQRTALNAIAFLYKKYLERSEFQLGDFQQARRPAKLPVVLTRDEVRLLLSNLEPPHRLCGQLIYGSGLRLMEVCRLRVKDIDLRGLSISVREAKGGKQRVTTLAESCVESLQRQLSVVELYWHEDRSASDWGGRLPPVRPGEKIPPRAFRAGLAVPVSSAQAHAR
jgi:integrase